MSSAENKINVGPILDADNNIRYTSVSQLETGERCLRKWYYEKIERVKQEPTQGQIAGTALHDEMYGHFTRGEALGPVGMAGIHLKPDGPFTCETPTMWITGQGFVESLIKVDGTPLVGYIDIMQPHRVIDIKRIKDAKYAKTPDQLAGNLQMLGYALHTWACHNGHREPMTLTHWYFEVKGKNKVRSYMVDAVVEADRAIAEWARTTPIMRSMREVAKLGRGQAERVPGNPAACNDYGGCHLRDRCSVAASDLLDSLAGADESMLTAASPLLTIGIPQKPLSPSQLEEQAPMAFFNPPPTQQPNGLSPAAQQSLQRFRGGNDEQALLAAQVGYLMSLIETANYGTPPLTGALALAWCRHLGQPETQAIAGTRSMQSLERPVESVEDLMALATELKLDDRLAGMPTTVAVAGADQMRDPVVQGHAAAPAQPLPVVDGVLPPDAPSQDERKRPRAPSKVKAAKAEAPPAPAAQQFQPAQNLAPATAAPAQVFTPPSAPAAPQPAVLQAPAPTPPLSPPAAVAQPSAPMATLEPQAGGYELYIDCLPAFGEQPKPLYEYAAEAMASLAKMAKVDDVRLVDKSSPLAYGNWRAALGAVVIKRPPPPGRWFIDTRGSEPNEVIAMSLLPNASVAVRGLR